MEKTLLDTFNRTRVVCFNETPMSLPMWAHYANDHQGVCMSFETNLEEHLKPDDVPLKVSYSKERPSLDIGDFESSHIGGEEVSLENASRFVKATYLTKSMDWRYEKEWRAFDNGGKAQGYKRISSLRPHSIIFGMNTSSALKADVADKFGDRLKLLEAHPADDKYELNFKELN